MSEPWQLTLTEAATLIHAGQLSPVELAASVVERIDAREASVGALVAFDSAEVLDQARRSADRLIHGEYDGPLHGIPITLKDLFDWEGKPTRANSTATSPKPATQDSEVARRLRSAGAVLLGKVHTHEFAYGAVTPTTRNPYDTSRIPGGSSGGSAAAVAAGFGCLSVGTDTAGSVRIPSSLCGVVGLKPTYGTISRTGLIPLSWSLDHPGPIARTVGDVAAGFSVLTGCDACDPRPRPGLRRTSVGDVDSMVVGVPSNHYFERCESGVAEACRTGIDRLVGAGIEIREIHVPLAAEAGSVGHEIMSVEAAAYHSRTLVESADELSEYVRIQLEVGSLKPGSAYVRALRAREVVRREWQAAFEGLEAIVTPTTPFTAPLVGETHVVHPDGSVEEIGAAMTRFTMQANVTGLPALTVPCGHVSGRPVGLQLIGRPFREDTLFALGGVIEPGGART